MQLAPVKNSRSEQARINGARSRGPKTSGGRARSRAAATRHGLYATHPSLQPTVAEPAYAALRQHYQSVWAPSNAYLGDKVDDLVAYRWELNRLREVRRQFLARVFNDVALTHDLRVGDLSAVAETEIRAASESGTLDRLDLRIRRCNLEISRIERDLIRAARFFSTGETTQNCVKTNDVQAEGTQTDPIAWVEDEFGIDLDVHQAAVLTAQSPVTALAASRFSGKTTALALRALYEASHRPDARIACLSPGGALLDAVRELAGDVPPQIRDTWTTDATLVLLDDAAEVANEPVVPPGACLIAAATPRGAAGFFYRLWNEAGTERVFAPAPDCDTVAEALLRQAETALNPDTLAQEFHCRFLESPRPRCRLSALAEKPVEGGPRHA